MRPPERMQTSSQQSMMQRLLANGASASSPSSAVQASRNSGIEDIAARLHRQQNGTSNGNSENHHNGWNGNNADVLSISNNTPLMNLSCDECGIQKTNSEEMEVHIKMEHLNWLPFQCPICLSERASDAQMREHLHSSHRKNMNKFIYVDNVNAKRRLQILMDRALSNSLLSKKLLDDEASSSSSRGGYHNATMSQLTSLRKASNANDSIENKIFDMSESPPAEPLPGVTEARKRPHVEISEGSSSTDALLASISRAATGGGVIEGEVDEDDPLSLFTPKKHKSDVHHLLDINHANSQQNEDFADENELEGVNPISVLDNVAALFAHSDGRIEESFSSEKSSKHQNSSKANSQGSKKRVLGECSKCNKPVTAGARQMHMFFHLAKDHGTYRFRCKFDGCPIEHYRKDQMENHQSKIHGKIDPEMMEDRSLELFQRCQELNHELFVANRSIASVLVQPKQELSAELLGAKGNGTPSAASKDNSSSTTPKEKPRGSPVSQSKSTTSLSTSNSLPTSTTTAAISTSKLLTDEEHPLECRLCHKTMQNRIRGFHILWHMAKDMGINRYICKFCNFGHDRSQSVQTHGKKEHGTEDVVQDRINEYEDEVKQMSESCFGFQALFSQDNKRRSKIPVTMPLTDKSDSDTKSHEGSLDGDEETIIEPEVEPENDEEDEHNKKSKSSKRKTNRFPRFGLRRPPSKSKKEEMAKLREASLMLGGAQYYKKKINETAICEECGKATNSRLSEHCYTHMDGAQLFLCPKCELGHTIRETVTKHIRDVHDSNDRPIDNRLKYAQEIKDSIQKCYPAFFIDAPIPTPQDIEKLKQHIVGSGNFIAGITDVDDEEEHEGDEEELEHDLEELDDDSHSMKMEQYDEMDES